MSGCKKDKCCPKNYRGPKGPAGQRGPRGLQGIPGEQGAPGPSWMSFVWNSTDVYYQLTGAADTYQEFQTIVYPGSTLIAVPTVITVSSFATVGPSADYDIELYDVVTTNVLAFKYNITNLSEAMDQLTITSANWPASRSRIRIRVRNNAGTGNNRIAVSAMTWE